jgi:hypothetical protein
MISVEKQGFWNSVAINKRIGWDFEDWSNQTNCKYLTINMFRSIALKNLPRLRLYFQSTSYHHLSMPGLF